MASFANTDWDNVESKELLQYLDWFCKNTTNKIFHRMDTLNVGKSGALRNSIRSIVYNNAGGNGAMVRFYYLAYGRFIEMALGHNRNSDRDLVSRDSNGNRVVEGVKIRNRKVPAMTSWDTPPINVTFQGQTDSGISVGTTGKNSMGARVDRSLYHKAKPFLMSSINAEMNRISVRIAEKIAFFGSIQLTQAVVGIFKGELEKDKDYAMLVEQSEQPWLERNGWYAEHNYNVQAYIDGDLNTDKSFK